MSKNFWIIFGLLIVLVQVAFAQQTAAVLSVEVTGFSHDQGSAVGRIFAEGSDVMKIETALKQVTAKIKDGHATLIFPDLQYGPYAVSVFHDEDGNGDLKHNFFGFPSEPLGFSANFKLGLFSGLPSFKKLQFLFSNEVRKIEIKLK